MSERKTLTFRVVQRYADNKAEGKVQLSTEKCERPFPITRDQAERLAKSYGAQFVEAI